LGWEGNQRPEGGGNGVAGSDGIGKWGIECGFWTLEEVVSDCVGAMIFAETCPETKGAGAPGLQSKDGRGQRSLKMDQLGESHGFGSGGARPRWPVRRIGLRQCGQRIWTREGLLWEED